MTTLVRPRLRELTLADAGRILEITRLTGVFRDEELSIAEEVFLAAVGDGRTDGRTDGQTDGLQLLSVSPSDRPYYTVGADLDGRLVGWICWGSTPCTVRTYDLYWLAVDPAAHRQGVAAALIDEMERRLSGKARLISVDTSGRPDYGPTRAFYLARGYKAVATVPDFYAPGDDQVIFTKRLA